MPALIRTRALVADLAQALGLPDLPPDDSGGYRLDAGNGVEVLLYGGDDATLLAVVPLAPLPRDVGYGLALLLLRRGMFDAPTRPFVVGADPAGNLVFWARLPLDAYDGAALADVIAALAREAVDLRDEIAAVADAA